MAKVFLADKETQDKIYNIVSDEQVYGFIEHYAETNPDKRIEYIGANKDYIPITQDLSKSKVNYGSWKNFPLIVGNKPWMVDLSGVPKYRLKEDDYTKKLNGEASGISDLSGIAGAFAWLPKIYSKQQIYGDDRYVFFSLKKKEGFEPLGFTEWNKSTYKYDELEGVWLPMFYGSSAEKDLLVGFNIKESKGEKWVRSIAESSLIDGNVSLKSIIDGANLLSENENCRGYRLFEGAIINIISDLLIMFARTTDLMSVFGNGAKDVENMTMRNEVIGGGQFKGTSDGRSLNKILHSVVLGSYLQWQIDTRMYTSNSTLIMLNSNTKIDQYPINVDKHSRKNLIKLDSGNMIYKEWHGISRYHISEQGIVPAEFSQNADVPTKGAIKTSTSDAIALRFGTDRNGGKAGLRVIDLYSLAINGDMSKTLPEGIGVSPMLIPPVGFAP